MRLGAAGFALMTLVSQSLAAQQTASDSAVARRPERSILGWAEVVGMTAITGMAFSRDQLLRNRLHDRHDALGRTLSDLGNGFGDGALVYPGLFALSMGGRILKKPAMQKLGSRALESTLLAGAAALALKSIIGRQRPNGSGSNA